MVSVMGNVRPLFSVANMGDKFTGVAMFSGERSQPYAVWVEGLIYCYHEVERDTHRHLKEALDLIASGKQLRPGRPSQVTQ